MTLTLNILLGIVAGLFSGGAIYLYSYDREKARRIIEYAKRTAERAQLVSEEAKRCSEGEPIIMLKKLVENSFRRQFAGNIVDKSKESNYLQQTIGGCNCVISDIQNLYEEFECGNCEETVFQKELMHKSYALNGSWLDLINAIVDYDVREDKIIQKWHKYSKCAIYIGGFIFIVIFLIELINT